MKKAEFVREWLKKAEHDIGTARLIADNGMAYTDQVCYHSQQAVEKCFKAILFNSECAVPKTHNLRKLILAASEFIKFDESFEDIVDILDSYSVDVRYPTGDFEPSAEEAEEALVMATKVFEYISKQIK